MFTPEKAREHMNSNEAVRLLNLNEQAGEIRDDMLPWFDGLATFLRPLTTSSEPQVTVDPDSGAYVLAVAVRAPGGLPAGNVVLRMGLNPHNRAVVRMTYVPNSQAIGTVYRPSHVWALVAEYARLTFGEEYVQAHGEVAYVSGLPEDG